MFLVVQDSCDAADDSLHDLVDYCHRKLTLLASGATRPGTATLNQHNQTSSIAVKTLLLSQFGPVFSLCFSHSVCVRLGEGITGAEHRAGV